MTTSTNDDVANPKAAEEPPVLLVERSAGIVTVTLNRPDALNSFDDDLHREFPRIMADLDDDDEARAVVLTGAGRAFSAGGNTDDFLRFADDYQARRRAMRQGRKLVEAMLSTEIPVIAAVNGPAVGLGCTLATLCDIVLVADKAFLADPHVSVGLVAGDGSAVTWPFLTSLLKAKEYLLTGKRIPAEEAVALGLANRVVPAADLLGEARALAEQIAAQPPQAVRETKSVLNQHLRGAMVATLGMGLAAESQSHDTAEYRAIGERFVHGGKG
ncbi:enoyl-CoA hydratase/isomerase family protein [Streptomyces brasiliensis]|uniref:Enoyl-CoA hydratase n=1 Tax=Streptomyces brasiliensis TaxID=1954 RepID=A0A917P5T2_9ACTN|nr:enoyl-CoA hydratase/isomerase family protein [Streptomyces brasiliensis]GGJ62748.1 enoyl-CoA hydratase [Streptomyces brasiliensis]